MGLQDTSLNIINKTIEWDFVIKEIFILIKDIFVIIAPLIKVTIIDLLRGLVVWIITLLIVAIVPKIFISLKTKSAAATSRRLFFFISHAGQNGRSPAAFRMNALHSKLFIQSDR